MAYDHVNTLEITNDIRNSIVSFFLTAKFKYGHFSVEDVLCERVTRTVII